MKVGEYLFKKLGELGVGHVFGIPGDYAIPIFESLDRSGLQVVVCTHEPAVGFAADAYARLRGLGAAVVTFGAGGLNMVNSIAQAYAEKSPVIVISGAPEIEGRKVEALLHHKVKTFETQLNVYREVTGLAVALRDATTAGEEIDRVFETTMRIKRPGYIEVPRDLVGAEIVEPVRPVLGSRRTRRPALEEAMEEVASMYEQSRAPVIYAGAEIMRLNLRKKLVALSGKLNLPVVTSIEGKAVFPEDHPNFIGIYMGRAGDEAARRAVEGSDCLLMLGAFLTDVSTGLFTARVNRGRLISASSEGMTIGYHQYPEITLSDLVGRLLGTRRLKARRGVAARQKRTHRKHPAEGFSTMDVIDELNGFLIPEQHVVVADVGDALYASVELETDAFLGPGYYNSMGFGVPAAVAAQLAFPEKRTIALVGDGAFQMTGMELSTAKKLGVRPTVVILNNARYATLEAIAGVRGYFALQSWDYVAIAGALGGSGTRVQSRQEFRKALAAADASESFYVIEVRLSSRRLSPTWEKIAEGVRSMSGISGGGRQGRPPRNRFRGRRD